MALIKCPECGKEISDKSNSCIFCGYPINELLNSICKINGVEFDLSLYKERVASSNQDEETLSEIEYELFNEIGTITIDESEELLNIMLTTNKVPKSFNSHHTSALLPRFPRCGSTSISTGSRGWKWTTGFIGSGKTVNRCASCGHIWEPGR